MLVKKFPYDNFKVKDPRKLVNESFQLLYSKNLISLDNFGISLRVDEENIYIGSENYNNVLFKTKNKKQLSTLNYKFHSYIYEKLNNIGGVVNGFLPYTLAILDSFKRISKLTGMLEKRNIKDLNSFVFESDEYHNQNFDKLLKRSKAVSENYGMNVIIFILKNNNVICCGQNIFEAITYYNSIEHNAKINYFEKIFNKNKGL